LLIPLSLNETPIQVALSGKILQSRHFNYQFKDLTLLKISPSGECHTAFYVICQCDKNVEKVLYFKLFFIHNLIMSLLYMIMQRRKGTAQKSVEWSVQGSMLK